MIPVKDKLTVKRPSGFDDWGEPTSPISETINCRIDYNTEVVKDKDGNDVVSKAIILILGSFKIGYDDVLTWTDELGTVHEEQAVNVGYIKDFSSKVLFTKVVI